jgi:hypothetical protein
MQMASLLAHAATEAFRRARALSRTLLQSRSPFGVAPFSIEAAEAITEAVEQLIQARLRERDEQWIQYLREAMELNQIHVDWPPTT